MSGFGGCGEGDREECPGGRGGSGGGMSCGERLMQRGGRGGGRNDGSGSLIPPVLTFPNSGKGNAMSSPAFERDTLQKEMTVALSLRRVVPTM